MNDAINAIPRRHATWTVIAVAAAIALGSTTAWSADWYVSPAGTDPAGCATAPNDGVGSNDPPFLTIGKAFSCAANGDIVHVAAGNYNETLLTLSKSLTVLGPQAGVLACGRVASEAVVAPTAAIDPALTINGSSNPAGIVIDGFTFSGSTNFACVRLENGTAPGMQFLNNRVRGFTGIGVFWNRSVVNGVFGRNEVDGSSQIGNGADVQFDGADAFHGLQFTDNCIINTANTGLIVDGNHNWTAGSGASQPPAINGNTFRACGTAVNLGSRSYNNTASATASISNNLFQNNVGTGLQGGPQNTLISNNRFLSNATGIALTSFSSLVADRGAQNCRIAGNTFSGNTAEGVFMSAAQAVGSIATNVVNQNDFLGLTVGLRYNGTENIDAQCNWWSHINGPNFPLGGNTNASGSAIVGLGANIDFVSWLNGSIAGTPLCDQPGPTPAARTTWGSIKVMYR